MKAYTSILLKVIVIVTCFRQITGQGGAELKQIFGECYEKHQISMEAIKTIIYYEEVPEDYEAMCWISCVMKESGMIKEGKFDWEHNKNIIKQGLTGEEDKAKVDKIAEICQAKVPQKVKDECLLGYFAALCQLTYWKEFGLPKGIVEL